MTIDLNDLLVLVSGGEAASPSSPILGLGLTNARFATVQEVVDLSGGVTGDGMVNVNVLNAAQFFMLWSSESGETHAYDGGAGTVTNGANGAFADIVNAVSDALTIGAASGNADPEVGSRVFYMDLYNDEGHGVYTITDLGGADSPWVLTRATDYDTDLEGEQRVAIVLEGTMFVAESAWWHATGDVLTSYIGFCVYPLGGGFAAGYGAIAAGPSCIALGQYTLASGINAVAIGQNAAAVGNYATAIGHGARATGVDTYAFGVDTAATDDGAMVIGREAVSTGANSLNIGSGTYPATVIGTVTPP